MKTFFKFCIIVFLVATSIKSYGQTFGIKAGLNLANQKITRDLGHDYDDIKLIGGYHFGVNFEFPLSKVLFIEPVILLISKGFKSNTAINELGLDIDYKQKTRPLYLDIPLNIKYKINFGKAKMYFATGPYLGIGIGGKIKTEASYLSLSEENTEDIQWGGDNNDDYQQLDYGLNFGLGIETGNIGIGFRYGMGLANIAANQDGGLNVKNNVFGLSFSYRFIRGEN